MSVDKYLQFIFVLPKTEKKGGVRMTHDYRIRNLQQSHRDDLT